MPARAKKKLTDAHFVLTWEACPTAQEAADKLGLSRRAAISRAWRLRQAGVKLTLKPKSVKRSKAHVTNLNRLLQK